MCGVWECGVTEVAVFSLVFSPHQGSAASSHAVIQSNGPASLPFVAQGCTESGSFFHSQHKTSEIYAR